MSECWRFFHFCCVTVYYCLSVFLVPWFCIQVWPLGQRRSFDNAELWARSIPHNASHSLAAVERVPCDGHCCHEAGGEWHPQLLPHWPDQTQPPHSGHAPLHTLQNLPRGQSHHPRDPGETAASVSCGDHISYALMVKSEPEHISDCLKWHFIIHPVFDPNITGHSVENAQTIMRLSSLYHAPTLFLNSQFCLSVCLWALIELRRLPKY